MHKFIKDADEIEDMLQDIFIKTYRNLYGFNTDKKFSSWIYRIAHNEAINYIKKYYKGHISLDDVEYKIVEEKMDLMEKMDLSIKKEKIERALNDLKLDDGGSKLVFYSIETPVVKLKETEDAQVKNEI